MVMNLKTIIDNKEETLVVNKSKFICLVYKINSINDVSIYLDEVKKKYEGATHYCYAYILDNYTKCSDDKEPNGTAGLPILNVLKKKELNNVLVIVVRYFGGIKLGTGGLSRAYTNATINCLDNNLKEIIKGLKIELIFDYNQVKKIDNLFDNVISKEFEDKIKYIVLIEKDKYLNIKDNLNDIEINIIEDNIVI